MADGMFGEIRLFAGNYAPVNWLPCDGRLMLIGENQALFSLLGTVWGGDGRTTFALPDLRGRVPVGQGQGTNLTNRILAQMGGNSTVQLTVANIPAHNHIAYATNQPATTATVAQGVGLATPLSNTNGRNVVRYAPPSGTSTAPTVVDMDSVSIAPDQGGSQPHSNLMPYLALTYMICTLGLYPERQ